jgi:arylsulfatase A-like enzyme
MKRVGIFRAAIWFGLLAGLSEIAVSVIRQFILGEVVWFWSPHLVWMTPLADVALFVVVGLILLPAAWRWPEPVSLAASLIFPFLAFLSLLFLYEPLHRYAQLLLAAGLATQTARFIAAHSRGFHTLVRRTIVWIVIVAVGLAMGVHGWEWMGERRAFAKLPPPAPGAPNVLMIVLDTVRAQNLSAYGYHRNTTPQLEKFAKAGISFDRAIAPTSWTLPSHATMFTGRWPHELTADWLTALDGAYPTLAEVLGARGYVTAGFIANEKYVSRQFGLGRGFLHYEDILTSWETIVRSSSLCHYIAARLRSRLGYQDVLGRKDAAQVNQEFLDWLSRQERRPFFVFLNYFDAHNPYFPPKPFDTMFGSKNPRRKPINWYTWEGSPADLQLEVDAYDGSIAWLDRQLGLLFDELQKRNLFENTLTIVTSDHGEEFGEHNLVMHGTSLYMPSLHVPLLLRLPGRVPAGKSVAEPISLRDLPATVVGLVGLEATDRFPGISLARYWNGTNNGGDPIANPLLSEITFTPNLPARYPVTRGDMKSLVANNKHYIKNGDGREELYHFDNDPAEGRDLAGAEETKPVLTWLRSSLARILGKHSSADSLPAATDAAHRSSR